MLNRYVALKIMAPELAADPEFVKRFKREASAAASLAHENLVGTSGNYLSEPQCGLWFSFWWFVSHGISWGG
jgi:serine/threonine protein kinase